VHACAAKLRSQIGTTS